MAKQISQSKSLLTLADFQKDGYFFHQLSNGSKFTIANVPIGVYNQLFTKSVINPTPRYQRPYTYTDTFGGEGDVWQQGLVAAVTKGEFIQPIHFRFRTKTINLTEGTKSLNYYILEVLDGGHRTRTLCNFIACKIKTPADFTITLNGVKYECSNLLFSQLEEVVQEYFLSIEEYEQCDKIQNCLYLLKN